MPHHLTRPAALATAILAIASVLPAAAQPARRPPAPAASPQPPAPTPTPPPVPAEPGRTTASFGLWELRCERPAPGGAPVCEAAQTVSNPQGQAVAQFALGRPARGEPMRMTLLVPPSVSLATAPRLVGAEPGKEPGPDAPALELGWRRCLPGGCVADAALPDDVLTRLRGRAEPSRLVFADGAGRDAVLPFVPQGLPQALDALAKQDAH